MAEILKNTLETEEDILKDRYLIFFLANENYGIEVRHVTEII